MWTVKARANHILRKGKMNQAEGICSPGKQSENERQQSRGERKQEELKAPVQAERRANKMAMSNSKRHQETKGQFRIKNDLIKWLRTWVGSGLGRLYPGTHSR